MFKDFQERVKEKIRSLAPDDEQDKAIQHLVSIGTAESLQGPNWAANMELADLVNKDPVLLSPKMIRIIGRTLGKAPIPSQVLALGMLDTCVRNCHSYLHGQLASSILWADLLKLATDTSVNRIDLEVRDKILTMVEDYGKFLPHPPTFAEAYESLVDQGVDFPVRNPEDIQPIEIIDTPLPTHTEPQHAASSPGGSLFANLLSNFGASSPSGGGPLSGAAGQTAATGARVSGGGGVVAPRTAVGQQQPVATVHGGVGTVQRGGVDPEVLQGMSPEDRLAVETVMREMAIDIESAQEAAAIAASLQSAGLSPPTAGPNVGGNPTSPQSGEATAGTVPPARVGPPPLPEDNSEALQVISNSVSVFNDLVASIPDEDPSGVRDPLIRDLADQCGSYRQRLTRMAQEVTEEDLLISALAQNDTLTTAMARYDTLLAQVLAQGPMPAANANDTAARAAAAASAISQTGPVSAGPQFTLLDEEEEEAEPESAQLISMRNQECGLKVHGGRTASNQALSSMVSGGLGSPKTSLGGNTALGTSPVLDLLGEEAATTATAAPALPTSSPAKEKPAEPLI